MYVQVRTIDCKRNVTVTISKITTVKEFKEIIKKEMDVPIEKQRLFFRGKQLEDDYKMFDYNVNVNDVIQLMIKPDLPQISEESKTEAINISKTVEEKPNSSTPQNKDPSDDGPIESLYYKVGDIVDAKDICYGAWFEGKIVGIERNPSKSEKKSETDDLDDGLVYKVSFLSYPDDAPLLLALKDVRPRARIKIAPSAVKVGDNILVNYNIEEPSERGYWYELKVTSIGGSERKPQFKGTLLVGTENAPLVDCSIQFCDDLMKIELPKIISEKTPEELELMQKETSFKRVSAPYCSHCSDNPRRKCKECGCNKCGGKDEPGKQVLCDECNMAFHIWCLDPPLKEIPDVEEWYCSECKNDENEIVKAGEKLKESKKKAKMASANSKSNRDWGKGMACVGRTKECTLVPPNHFGPVPGIEVGTLWKFRVQVSEAGIHRPHVAGIHGRESEGAYSIVLSGGYEDDIDNGDEFMYTGSGGRDLSGNKRTAEQSCDQQLTRMNKALASNCNAPLDAKKGAEASDWKKGKPVRVVRNFKLAKHSKYAPQDGNRYDGIYKVVKYYPQKGKSGFRVWRYVLRRDDPTPAPWTKEGKRRIETLGLEMLYPEGYLAAMEKKEQEGTLQNFLNGKRVLEEKSNQSPSAKRLKTVAYELEPEIDKKVMQDEGNEKLWSSVKDTLPKGKQVFLAKVVESFECICCQELVFQPITTPCKHNMCKGCLQRSFTAEVYSCPCCRTELGKKYTMDVNSTLQEILLSLFPGYSVGR